MLEFLNQEIQIKHSKNYVSLVTLTAQREGRYSAGKCIFRFDLSVELNRPETAWRWVVITDLERSLLLNCTAHQNSEGFSLNTCVVFQIPDYWLFN